MRAPWKPGQPIRPHEFLHDPDPAGAREREQWTVAGYAVGIVACVLVVGMALSALLTRWFH